MADVAAPALFGGCDVQIAGEGFVGAVGEDNEVGAGLGKVILPRGTPFGPVGQLRAVDAECGNGYAASGIFDIDVADVPRHRAAEGQGQAAVAADDLPAAASGGDFASVERQGLLGQDGFGENGNLPFAAASVFGADGDAAAVGFGDNAA